MVVSTTALSDKRRSGDGATSAAKILIVEDEQIVALELQDRLTRMGHTVVGVAASGEDAIEMSRRLCPDLILMDIKLQGEVDGIEAAASIRKEINTAIVYLTAFADEPTLERAKVTQPYGYILKPFHERELHVVIELSLYRHRTERTLREGELWRRALLRSVGNAVVATDPVGRVKLMNPLAESLTGWKESEAIGARLEEVLRTVQRPERRRGIWEDATTLLIGRDGSERPIELERTPIREEGACEVPMGTVCVFRDISEGQRIRDRRRFLAVASSELSSSLDRKLILRPIASLIAHRWTDWCVIHLAGEHGRLHAAASAHRDEAAGARLAELDGVTLRHPETSDIARVAESHTPMQLNDLARDWPARALGMSRTSELVAAAAIIAPLCARGRCLGTLTVGSAHPDAFDHGDAELAEELARRIAYALDNAQLYAVAQRATAMRDDVLAIVSHDLRNPLTAITMGAEQLLLAPDTSGPGRVVKNATVIKRNAEQAAHLIDDLIDVGRVDTGRLKIDRRRTSATSLVGDALSAFEATAAERSIRIVCPALRDAELLCDANRIHQVFSNLIGNAIKFSPEGGVIRVEGAPGGDTFTFSVSDQGKGMPPDQVDRVFDRYWQAPDASHRGSGLGLYIAKGIVDAHGGNIWVESTPGRGSTFRFTVPLAPRSDDAVVAAP
jgi:PAS domain S-box-containing protein